MTELHPTLDLAEELQAATHSKADRAKTFQRFVGGGEIKFRRPPDQFTFVVSVSWKPTSRPTRQRGDVRRPWGIVIFFGSGQSQGLALGAQRDARLDGRFWRDLKHDDVHGHTGLMNVNPCSTTAVLVGALTLIFASVVSSANIWQVRYAVQIRSNRARVDIFCKERRGALTTTAVVVTQSGLQRPPKRMQIGGGTEDRVESVAGVWTFTQDRCRGDWMGRGDGTVSSPGNSCTWDSYTCRRGE